MDFDDFDEDDFDFLDDDDFAESDPDLLKEANEILNQGNKDDLPFFMVHHKSLFYPAPLKKGDKIAIISPASVVKDEYVLGAMARLMERGYEPVMMDHVLGPADGAFSSTKGDRLSDFFEALEDSEIKAILCSRGGYGCCQLLANFSYGMIARNPKWLIGFSDVSALLAMWYGSDVASIHGPMAKHLSTMPPDDPCTEALFHILETGGRFDYSVTPHKFNRLGKSTGTLLGGNMAVLEGLANTPHDLLRLEGREKGIILFFEDIAEPIYKVNRILWRLYLSGTLFRVKGIVFGQFTEYKPDKNFNSMEEMINEFFERNFIVSRYPIVYNFPVGHTDFNLPLTEGAPVELDVTENGVRIHTIF